MKFWIKLSIRFLLIFSLPLSMALAYQVTVKKHPGKLRFGNVEEESIYAKVGIQRNDVIREINGKTVDDTTPISEVEAVVLKGGTLVIERNGKTIRKKLKAMENY